MDFLVVVAAWLNETQAFGNLMFFMVSQTNSSYFFVIEAWLLEAQAVSVLILAG